MKNTENIILLIFSKIFILISSLVVILFIAHARDKDLLGKYCLVMTWIVIFKIIASLGIWEFISREIGKNPKESNKFLVHGLSLGLLSSLLFVGIMLGSAFLLNYPQDIEFAIFIGGFAVIPLTLVYIFEGGFIANKKVVYITYISIFENLSATIIYIVLILKNYELISLIVVFTSIRVLSFVIILLTFHYKVHQLRLSIQLSFFRKLIPTITIFGAITILSALFLKIDIIMLSKLRGVASVAMYSTATKIMETLLIVPLASMFIYLPVIAKEFAKNSKHSVEQQLLKITRALFIVVLPLGLGMAYFAKPVIITLYGEQYVESFITLQILMIAFLVLSIDIILGMICKAGGYQKMDLLTLIANTSANIILNIILIPPLGYIGASVATVLSICLSLSLHHIIVKKSLIQLHWFKTLGKPLMATLFALLLLHLLENKINFIAHAMLFVVGYGLILILIKGISADEIKSLFKVLTLYRVRTNSSTHTLNG